MKHHERALWVALGLAALIAGVIPASEAGGAKLRRAPDFELQDYHGKKVRLESFRGKVVLLEFLQAGCPACQVDAPALEDLFLEYKDKGVVFLGISHDPGGAKVLKEFAQKYDISFPLLIGDTEVAVRYIGVTPEHSSFDIPRFFVINREGYIVRDMQITQDVNLAQNPEKSLEQAIHEALATGPAQ